MRTTEFIDKNTGQKKISIVYYSFIACVCFVFVFFSESNALSGAIAGQKPVTGNFLVQKCFYYMRGTASVSTVEMIIHRPGWQRKMSINAWTLGDKDSIFFITSPPKDNGNGTLKKGREMWIFNPKINRVIKLPPSMMSQSWMGSDFSNNDLSKTDSLLNDYNHSIINERTENGIKIYTIKSVPKPMAPVIWGMLKLDIRQDFILLKEVYYDEDNKPVKVLSTSDICMMGNRLFPRVWKMQKSGLKNEYTILVYKKLKFVNNLPKRIFTLSNLKNPGIMGN